jgi:hypothetical protein
MVREAGDHPLTCCNTAGQSRGLETLCQLWCSVGERQLLVIQGKIRLGFNLALLWNGPVRAGRLLLFFTLSGRKRAVRIFTASKFQLFYALL